MPAKKTKKVKSAKKTVKGKGVDTSVNLVLDESASMAHVQGRTISSVNEFIQSLKVKGGGTVFSLTKFNTNETKVVQSGVAIEKAQELTLENYNPDGGTPLFDAVGRTISAIKKNQKAKRAVLVAIITDGEENQSTEYTREQIAKMIKDQQKNGWTFVYLGANHDAWAAATSLGIKPVNTVTYKQDNVDLAVRGLCSATLRYVDQNKQSYSGKVRKEAFLSAEDKDTIEGGTPA